VIMTTGREGLARLMSGAPHAANVRHADIGKDDVVVVLDRLLKTFRPFSVTSTSYFSSFKIFVHAVQNDLFIINDQRPDRFICTLL